MDLLIDITNKYVFYYCICDFKGDLDVFVRWNIT